MSYKIPGTTVTEIGQTVTPTPSSTQRKPCFIGKASTYKTALYESLVRGTSDTLAYGSYGIYSILEAGTQKGLSNLTEGTDFTVNSSTGNITWITDTETKVISGNIYGLNLFSHLTNFSAFATAVSGVNATSGYQGVGLNVTAVTDSGITSTGIYGFKVNTVNYNITATVGNTINDIITLMQAQVTGAGFTVALINADIRITNNSTGSSANVTLAAGTGVNLYAKLTSWTNFASAVAGTDATSGYQKVGLSTTSSAASGLSANTRYYFSVNGTEYFITTSTGVTNANIVSLIDAAVVGAGFVVTFASTDILFTNSVTGVSSIVTLAETANHVASNGQLSFTLSAGITFAHLAGKAQVTCTVGSNNYIFGIADDISVTDRVINLSGTESQLNAITVSTVLTIQTILPVSTGGTYFISYQYTRPTSDYIYKEFSSFSDVLNDLGANIPDNPLVMIANLALTYYNVPTIGIVQVPASNQNSDYVDALQLIKYRDVQDVCLLNTSATVRNATITEINDRNLPANKRERMYYTGASALYPLGDNAVPNSVCGISYSILNEDTVFVNATRAQYTYKDPITNLDTQTTVDGAFIGAALAAYRDSFSYPAQTTMGNTIPGLTLFAEDFDDYYQDDALITAGNASCFLVKLGPQNSMVVVDDITTNNASVERNCINIITAKQFITRDVRVQLDRYFVGNLIIDKVAYTSLVTSFLAKLLNEYKNMNIIENVGSVVVSIDPIIGTQVNVFYSFYAVYTAKYFECTYTIITG